jgi:hypothetical protein
MEDRVFWQMQVLIEIGKIQRVLTFAKFAQELPYVNSNKNNTCVI